MPRSSLPLVGRVSADHVIDDKTLVFERFDTVKLIPNIIEFDTLTSLWIVDRGGWFRITERELAAKRICCFHRQLHGVLHRLRPDHRTLHSHVCSTVRETKQYD